MKKYLLFDLDGTLTDPMKGITNSVAYALEYYGIHVEDRTSLCSFIGPPLKDSFMEYYGFEEKKAQEAVWKYREYFSEKGIFENEVYQGIPQLLEQLTGNGRTLIVATSKPTVYARQILEHFELDRFFTDVQGSNLDGTRVNKDEVIAHALRENRVSDREEAVMIGDRKHDILGGKKCGLDTIGVLFGYGSLREMQDCKADRIAKSVEELGRMLLLI
ncbi:MAG: HAD family hydrolase [Lachnospiraceae bacterium]|jgi:phosphoglycolate phosphatase|nr:HAD family hydrolase [Lachnospiraceae bacterium]